MLLNIGKMAFSKRILPSILYLMLFLANTGGDIQAAVSGELRAPALTNVGGDIQATWSL